MLLNMGMVARMIMRARDASAHAAQIELKRMFIIYQTHSKIQGFKAPWHVPHGYSAVPTNRMPNA
jgi:hypothetical protein